MTARVAELFSLVESRDVRALWLKALDDSFTSLLGVYALSIDLMLDRSCLCSVNFTVRDSGISPNVNSVVSVSQGTKQRHLEDQFRSVPLRSLIPSSHSSRLHMVGIISCTNKFL